MPLRVIQYMSQSTLCQLLTDCPLNISKCQLRCRPSVNLILINRLLTVDATQNPQATQAKNHTAITNHQKKIATSLGFSSKVSEMVSSHIPFMTYSFSCEPGTCNKFNRFDNISSKNGCTSALVILCT